MDFSTEISQSTQFLVQEIRRMFDAAEARLDRLFARLLQPQVEEVDEPYRDAVSPPPPLPVVDEPYRVVASPPPHPSVVYEPYRDEAMAGADARAHYSRHLPCERGGLAAAWQPARSLAFAAGDAQLAVPPRRDTRAMATMATKSVGDLTEADLKGKHITDDYTTTSNSPTKCSMMVLNHGDYYVSHPASSLQTGGKKGGSIVSREDGGWADNQDRGVSCTFGAPITALAKVAPALFVPGTSRSSLKYQWPQDDLDSLVSITSDDDVDHLMDELDRIQDLSANVGGSALSHLAHSDTKFYMPTKCLMICSIGDADACGDAGGRLHRVPQRRPGLLALAAGPRRGGVRVRGHAPQSLQQHPVRNGVPLLLLVTEQCAWGIIGNVAREGAELRSTLLAQGALWPLARSMLSNRGSTTTTAVWALSNLIKGLDYKAANELIGIDDILIAITQNLEKADEELATEVARVVVYFSALSERATCLIVRSSVQQWLIGHLRASENLQLLIPVLRSLGNPVTGDGYMVDSVLIVGNSVTDQALSSLIKCLKSDIRVLKKEVSWAMSNIAASSFEHTKLIFASEATLLLMHLLRTTHFDIHREAAYTLSILCVVPAGSTNPPSIIVPQNEAAQLVAKYRGQGFQTLNLTVGKNFNSDLEVLAAIQLDRPDCSFILDANEEYTYGSFSFIGLDTNTLYEMVCPYCDSGFVAKLDDADVLMSHFDGMDPDFHRDPRVRDHRGALRRVAAWCGRDEQGA